MNSSDWPHWAWLPWALFGLGALGAWIALPPIPQPAAYHAFADTRAWLGIPRVGDVLSNLALLVAGAAGLLAVRRSIGRPAVTRAQCVAQRAFFWAVVLTAFGSACYHWAPDTPRLFWDRLPLSVVVAAVPVLVLTDRLSLSRAAGRALAAWLALGPLSVIYWRWSEAADMGDLRLYGAARFAALGAALVLLLALPPRHSHGRAYGVAFALFALATAAEHGDRAVFAATGLVSGHTVKHLLAGAALGLLAWMLARRRPIGETA